MAAPGDFGRQDLPHRPSRSQARWRYPLGTIAAYGPDNSLATKLVVSVYQRPGTTDPSAMETWTTVAMDVRQDQTIAGAVADFLRQHGVNDTISADHIIGC